MSSKNAAAGPIPAGYHSVTPWIISRDAADVIDFLKRVFDAEELGEPVYGEDGRYDHTPSERSTSTTAAPCAASSTSTCSRVGALISGGELPNLTARPFSGTLLKCAKSW
jgi:hypothetical protein